MFSNSKADSSKKNGLFGGARVGAPQQTGTPACMNETTGPV